MYANEKEDPPFDYSGSRVVIDDMDYGLWYIDAMENPERYAAKRNGIYGKVLCQRKAGRKVFCPRTSYNDMLCGMISSSWGLYAILRERRILIMRTWVRGKGKIRLPLLAIFTERKALY